MPLLFAGGVCCAVVGSAVLGAVRALVVFPELAVVGGAAGVASELALPGAAVFDFDSGVLALVVLPEFAAAGGVFVSVAEAEASAGFSVFVFFDFVVPAVPLVSPAAAVSPLAGAVLAAGSAAALFLVLLFLVGVLVFPAAAVSPASAVFVLDLLVPDDVPAAPETLVLLSVPVALVSAFFLLRDFFEVVDVSSEADCAAVASALSLAGFFFLDLLAVVLLCVWSSGFAASAAGFFFLDLLAVALLCV
jgi:hypothetical protein